MSKTEKHTVLKTRDLVIGYKNKQGNILIGNQINLNLFSGKLVCLLGKNGIGKSTLLRTMSKMQPALEGEIEVDGVSLKDISARDLAKKISLVLTERIPASNLTVQELIALGRQPYTNWIGRLQEEDLSQIRMAIEQSDLSDLSQKKCDELSDGQLQRAMICRALAQNTPIIMLDEPTAHLDIQHKIETFRLLRKIARELNRAILISTHEIQFATQIADEIWLMTTDGIICDGPERLIDSGRINLLFDENQVTFDKKTYQFIMR